MDEDRRAVAAESEARFQARLAGFERDAEARDYYEHGYFGGGGDDDDDEVGFDFGGGKGQYAHFLQHGVHKHRYAAGRWGVESKGYEAYMGARNWWEEAEAVRRHADDGNADLAASLAEWDNVPMA